VPYRGYGRRSCCEVRREMPRKDCRLRELVFVIGLTFAITGCGIEEATTLAPIVNSTMGTWIGITSDSVWVEVRIVAEDTDSQEHHSTGTVRVAAKAGDTLSAAVRGTNEPDAVLLNFGTRPEVVLGLFTGRFVDGASLAGVILGPESFGDPPVGPFPADGVDITLHRE
jgi:hypothetical protein